MKFFVATAGSAAVASVTPVWGTAAVTAAETVKVPVAKRIYNLAFRRAELAKIYEGHSWSINSAAEHIERMTELEMRELYRSSSVLRRLEQRGYPNLSEIVELAEEKVFGKQSNPQKAAEHKAEHQQIADVQDNLACEALLYDGYQINIQPPNRFPEPVFI